MDRRTFLFQVGPASVVLAIGCGDQRGQVASGSGSASAPPSPLAASAPATAPAATFNYTVSSGSVPVLYVNEYLASNVAGLTDEAGDHEDWIEIYNPGPTSIDLGGMYITDDLAAPTKYQIPATNPAETTVPAGGFLLLWADSEMGEGIRHVNIKLSANGEAIGLFTSAGESIDSTTFGVQAADVSMARSPDGSSNWVTDTTPTPAASNGSVPRP